MKNIFLIISLFSLSLISCGENERLVFDEKPSIYFNQEIDSDSIMYSFTMTTEPLDTILLKVKLLGTTNQDKYFKVTAAPESTAKEGVHYTKLKNEYLLKAGEIDALIPIYLIDHADLDTKSLSIIVNLVENESFDLSYHDKSKTRLFITDQVIQPSYWYDTTFPEYFGVYSKKKHEICIDEIMGHDFPIYESSISDDDWAYYMQMGRKASLYFMYNYVNDENGNLIDTWNPF